MEHFGMLLNWQSQACVGHQFNSCGEAMLWAQRASRIAPLVTTMVTFLGPFVSWLPTTGRFRLCLPANGDPAHNPAILCPKLLSCIRADERCFRRHLRHR